MTINDFPVHYHYITSLSPIGRPTPTVQWRVNDEVWPSDETQEPDEVTKVTLRVTQLGRQHLHAVFECRATNFNDTSPISATVTLDMNCEWQARDYSSLQWESHPLLARDEVAGDSFINSNFHTFCLLYKETKSRDCEWNKRGTFLHLFHYVEE